LYARQLLAGAQRDIREDQVDAIGGQFGQQGVDFVLMGDDGAGGSMERAGSRKAAETDLGTASEMPTVSLPGRPAGPSLTASRSSRPRVKMSSAY